MHTLWNRLQVLSSNGFRVSLISLPKSSVKVACMIFPNTSFMVLCSMSGIARKLKWRRYRLVIGLRPPPGGPMALIKQMSMISKNLFRMHQYWGGGVQAVCLCGGSPERCCVCPGDVLLPYALQCSKQHYTKPSGPAPKSRSTV